MNIASFFKSHAIKLIAVTMLLSGAVIIWRRGLVQNLNDVNFIKESIVSLGAWGVLAYIGLQILQVVIAVIPGDPIQISGGYLYGALFGFIYAYIGIVIGALLAFALARRFGAPLISKLVDEKQLFKYKQKLESNIGMIGLFALCLIPGIPKDILVYAVALTPIKARVFFPIYMIARIPAMFIASYMGAQLTELV